MHTSFHTGSVFFGRMRYCALLEKRLEAFKKGYRQNIGILGQPFSGKSFLIKAFVKAVDQSEILVVPVSCLESDSFERCAERWIGELMISLHAAIHHTVPDHFQDLINGLKKTIPKTLQKMKAVKKWIIKNRNDEAYRELLALTTVLHKEYGKKILMVIDEFDRLAELGLSDPFGQLGKEIMVQKETMFVVTSSKRVRSHTIFREKLSLLFGNFEVIDLGPFDFDEASAFISQSIPEVKWAEELKRFVVRITDAHPHYLELLINRLKITSLPEELNRETVIEVLSRELFDEKGMIYQHFQLHLNKNAFGRPFNFVGDILMVISLGHKKLSQISRFLHCKTNEVKKILEKLVSSEVLLKHGAFYQLQDPLFRYWLSKVYYRERMLVKRSPLASRESFKLDLNQAIEESIADDQKELPKRIVELFLKFRNDVVEINRRRFACPHFTEILSRPANGRVFPVFARNGANKWLCQVLSSKVTEEDVHTFLGDLKRLRGKIQKRLMIGLNGIELNAKLLAQEAKIQYLDLRNLNFLLDLFDQPKIIL